MRVPTANELLLAWERGLGQSPTKRTLELLAAASTDTTTAKLAALAIGTRDARLLRLRELLFGDRVAAVSRCPMCSEQLDVSFCVADIRADVHDVQCEPSGEPVHLFRAADFEIDYRVPSSADLLAVSAMRDALASQRALLQRCVIAARRNGVETAVDGLPGDITAALSHEMGERDSQAQIELALMCPACSHAWNALFDIAAFLWSEIHAWAQRTLRDVNTLARTYGWREADILAMSARRRQIYLKLARS